MKRTSATTRQLRTLDDADLARVNGGYWTDGGGDGGSGSSSFNNFLAVQLRLFVFTSDGICWGWNDQDCTGGQ